MANKRQQQRERTRARLFDAAIDVFRRDGMLAAKVEEIASLAGVSRASFYFHFPSKEKVVEEVFAEADAALADRMADTPHDATIEQVIADVASAIHDRWSDDPVLFSEVGLHALRLNSDADTLTNRTGARAALAEHFRRAADRGDLVSLVPPELLSDLFLAHIFVVAVGWASNPILPLDEMIKASGHLYLHGVARHDEAPSSAS